MDVWSKLCLINSAENRLDFKRVECLSDYLKSDRCLGWLSGSCKHFWILNTRFPTKIWKHNPLKSKMCAIKYFRFQDLHVNLVNFIIFLVNFITILMASNFHVSVQRIRFNNRRTTRMIWSIVLLHLGFTPKLDRRHKCNKTIDQT